MARRGSLFGLHLLADHFPSLHGLRALAIVSVLQVHVTLTLTWAGLIRSPELYARSTSVWFGMDLFFILSGFLIGTLLLPGEGDRPRPGMRRFYVRRAFRIIPLYYVVLTAIVLFFPLYPAQRAGLVYEYAYLINYPLFSAPTVMPWAWSLCVEEHFYLAVPLVAALLALVKRPAFRMSALLGLWALGFAVRYSVYASRPAWAPDDLFTALYLPTHTRFDILVAGMLLAYVQRYYAAPLREALKKPRAKITLALVPVACAITLLGPLAGRRDLSSVFAWGTITSVMYFALILLLLNTKSALTRWLSSRFFLRFATLGYGIYLVHPVLVAHVVIPAAFVMVVGWHLPVAVVWLSSLALLLLVATVVAYGLHLAVEKPALWIRDRVAGAPRELEPRSEGGAASGSV